MNAETGMALIALGANLTGPTGTRPLETLQAALAVLNADGVRLCAMSLPYETPCFPPGAGPDYVNAAAVLETTLSADALLAHLHAIEAAFGRDRKTRWGMRTLDIDLIAMGPLVLPDRATWEEWRALDDQKQRSMVPDRLVLPHPRMQDRAFVLVPLAEIAPDWIHPITGQSVAQMCDALAQEERQSVNALAFP